MAMSLGNQAADPKLHQGLVTSEFCEGFEASLGAAVIREGLGKVSPCPQNLGSLVFGYHAMP